MCVLWSQQVTIFCLVSTLETTIYPVFRHNFITGCFSLYIQTRWMPPKSIPKKPCPLGFLHLYIFHMLYWLTCKEIKKDLMLVFLRISYHKGEKKPWKWGWESPLSKWDGNLTLKLIVCQNSKYITYLTSKKNIIWLNQTLLQLHNFPGNKVASTLFPELRLVRKYNDVFKKIKLEMCRC